jgi:hypothetical protein
VKAHADDEARVPVESLPKCTVLVPGRGHVRRAERNVQSDVSLAFGANPRGNAP